VLLHPVVLIVTPAEKERLKSGKRGRRKGEDDERTWDTPEDGEQEGKTEGREGREEGRKKKEGQLRAGDWPQRVGKTYREVALRESNNRGAIGSCFLDVLDTEFDGRVEVETDIGCVPVLVEDRRRPRGGRCADDGDGEVGEVLSDGAAGEDDGRYERR
jgi:hypothetical protein